MRKIGFTGKCPNGDITVLADQISRLKEVCVPYTIPEYPSGRKWFSRFAKGIRYEDVGPEEKVIIQDDCKVDSLEVPLHETDVICGKKINKPELKILKDTLLDQEFDYSVHGELSVNLMDQENFYSHIEVLKRDIEVSSEINATHLVTHFGHTTNNIYENKQLYLSYLKRQQDGYAEMGEYAKKHNVTLAIENLFPFGVNYYAPLPSEIGKQIKDINHPNVKCCLDISHGYINCTFRNVHFFDEIKKMAPYSEHMHMHDSFGILKNMRTSEEAEDTSYGIGDLHLPLGWGDIPFEKIFKELKFPNKLTLTFELPERYIKYFIDNIKEAKRLIQLQSKD